MIGANVEAVRVRMAEAARKAGRETLPRLVGVTKKRSLEEIREVVRAGVFHLAENRWEEWDTKCRNLDAGISWRFLGTIQSRGLRKFYRPLYRIDSLDSLPHAELLATLSGQQGGRQAVLLEVNFLREPGRAGYLPEDIEQELERLASFDGLDIQGLMVMGPVPEPSSNTDRTRRVFEEARDFWTRLKGSWPFLEELSMGMSEDFEEGIRCGATEVRIGRLLFEGGRV